MFASLDTVSKRMAHLQRKRAARIQQPPVTEHDDGSVIIRLTPNRAQNISDISDAITLALLVDAKFGGPHAPEPQVGDVILTKETAHRLRGYAEQLAIIANDLGHRSN